MMAALILAVSIAALLQFFVSYCRSIIAACSRRDLSEQVREVTGIESRVVRGDEFHRLLQLVRLCPEPGDDRGSLRAVRIYYGLLSGLDALVRHLVPGLAAWAESERQGCAYFAAVALEHRIAYSRELMAQQMTNRL